jgi:hypothetical protein
MDLLAQLSFGTPFVLGALVILPVVWWLLRVTPPSPRRVVFPPLRLLLGLRANEETPARTPWWLLLLRLLAAALIIVALAEPLLGESKTPAGSGPLVFFVDNGWPAAHRWDDRQGALTDALRKAQKDGRAVAIIPTAAKSFAEVATLLDAGAADRMARELEPQSWLPDRKKALAALAKLKLGQTPEIVWLSDGLDYGDARTTADALGKMGRLRIVSDAPGRGPLALRPPANDARGFAVTVVRGDARGTPSGEVNALGLHGEQLASAHFQFAEGQSIARAKVRLPIEVRNEMAMLSIGNEDSAGATQLMDSSAKRRIVGLASAGTLESEATLLSDTYYLRRALEPYSDVRTAPLADLIKSDIAVLMLADVAKISGDEHSGLQKFIENGGVVIRFAGDRMTGETDDLIPVKLRTGGRYLGGALAWSTPQHLAEFPENSPFRGLEIPAEVSVTRQILAEPSVELADRTWARLADGTPLVTAKAMGKGWIVLFHITASPAWSSLPLSGLYVDMLRRLTQLSSGARPTDMATDANAVYPASEMLDGFGRLHKAAADIPPIRANVLAKAKASPQHPPGLYGAQGVQIALNTFGATDALVPMGNVGTRIAYYSASRVIALATPLLSLAAILVLLDGLISLWQRGHLTAPRRIVNIASLLLVALIVFPPRAHADDAYDMAAANVTRLAYVKTGVADVDAVSRAGLHGLGLILKTRTTFDPQEPVGIDIASDDLSFFPLLYWPMDPREKDLTPAEISKLSDYMRNGGTIVFDTRDATLGAGSGPNAPGQQTLRRLAKGLDLPPLQVVPQDHVLTKTFYLLQDFPGRWDGSKVWVEALPPPEPGVPAPARGGDGVSPVIIGGNDWAAAWAVDADGRPINACVPGGDMQREMAFRVGVNLVMYSLTGNYKTDQVHAPALLKRLGK